jgi:hypothetical protein
MVDSIPTRFHVPQLFYCWYVEFGGGAYSCAGMLGGGIFFLFCWFFIIVDGQL